MALRLEEEQTLQQLKLAEREHSCASEEGGEQQEEDDKVRIHIHDILLSSKNQSVSQSIILYLLRPGRKAFFLPTWNHHSPLEFPFGGRLN